MVGHRRLEGQMAGPGQRRVRRLGIAEMARVRRKRVEFAARAAVRLKTLVHDLCGGKGGDERGFGSCGEDSL